MADVDRNFYLDEWRVDEEFKWVADHNLRLIQNLVIKRDSKIIDEISNHYDADTTEIWEYLNAKARIKAGHCTNADRIRAMTDEELAVFLGNTKAFCCRDSDPSEEFTAEFKTWLKQPAVDNGACSANETSEKVQGGE